MPSGTGGAQMVRAGRLTDMSCQFEVVTTAGVLSSGVGNHNSILRAAATSGWATPPSSAKSAPNINWSLNRKGGFCAPIGEGAIGRRLTRQTSATDVPSSACLITNAFCAPVNGDAFMLCRLAQPKKSEPENSSSERSIFQVAAQFN